MSKHLYDNISCNTCIVIFNLKLPDSWCKILVKSVYSFKGNSFDIVLYMFV